MGQKSESFGSIFSKILHNTFPKYTRTQSEDKNASPDQILTC